MADSKERCTSRGAAAGLRREKSQGYALLVELQPPCRSQCAVRRCTLHCPARGTEQGTLPVGRGVRVQAKDAAAPIAVSCGYWRRRRALRTVRGLEPQTVCFMCAQQPNCGKGLLAAVVTCTSHTCVTWQGGQSGACRAAVSAGAATAQTVAPGVIDAQYRAEKLRCRHVIGNVSGACFFMGGPAGEQKVRLNMGGSLCSKQQENALMCPGWVCGRTRRAARCHAHPLVLFLSLV